MAGDVDLLLVTPPSRLEVYQGLSNEFAAIEPPVWSGLIAEFIRNRGGGGGTRFAFLMLKRRA